MSCYQLNFVSYLGIPDRKRSGPHHNDSLAVVAHLQLFPQDVVLDVERHVLFWHCAALVQSRRFTGVAVRRTVHVRLGTVASERNPIP